MRVSVTQAFDRWISHQSPATLDSLGTPRAWIALTLLVGVLLSTHLWLPGGPVFALDPGVPTMVYAIPATGGFGLALTHRAGRPYSRLEWLSVVVTSAGVHLFTVSLAAASNQAGTFVFGACLLFVAAMHGFIYRVTVHEPFISIGSSLAIAWGLWQVESAQDVAVLGTLGLCAVVGQLSMGTLARNQDRVTEEREEFRAAILAQQLEAESARSSQLAESLVDVTSRAHDARNALAAVELSADALRAVVEGETADPVMMRRIEARLRSGTARVRALVEHSIARGRAEADTLGVADTVAVEPVLTKLTREHARDRVAFDCHVDPPDLKVRVRGGVGALERILENVLVNAVQGDGGRLARQVRVHVAHDPSGGLVAIHVEDDGPGFPPGSLNRPIRAFESSKELGTGLGLYTVDRLVRASGGTLRRENPAQGGARVVMTLPRGGPS